MERFINLYYKLLRLYPKDFSGKFSDEMAALFAVRLEEIEKHRAVGIGLFVLKEFVAVISGSIREHLNEIRGKQGSTGSLQGAPRIDPRVRGAILLSVGFGSSQLFYQFLRMEKSAILDLYTDFLLRGFVALMLPEALSLMIALVLIFEISSRAKNLLPTSFLASSSYVIGIAILIRSVSLFTQIIPIDQKLIWMIHRFTGMFLVGLLMGYILDLTLSGKWKPGVITLLTGLSLFAADSIGYASFALYNLVLGTPLFGRWPYPEYLYLFILQATVKGLVLGIGLGYIQNQFKNSIALRAILVE